MSQLLSRSKGKRHSAIVEINMVPFIDVVLVLLIIFMVLTPILVQQQLSVNLPHSVSGSASPDRPIMIGVQSAGELTLNGKPIALSALEGALKTVLKSNPSQAILIESDKAATLQSVISVMDVAKRLNVGKLGISVEQKK